MNALPADDEIFDDLHSGVAALQDLARTESVSLTPKAVETLQRLETSASSVRDRLRRWKEVLKNNASRAAHKTNEVVRDHPWFFTVGALAVGVLAGLAIASSTNHRE